ncbi:MAG: hypothetical protein ACYC6Y_19300 [Thermoguttaceae bacterium]
MFHTHNFSFVGSGLDTRGFVCVVALAFWLSGGGLLGADAALGQQEARNVILVLSDDHRYDFMGFMPEAPDFLETPTMDRMAGEGAHLVNAFVSTSLC